METLHILKNVHHAFCSSDIVRLCSTVIGDCQGSYFPHPCASSNIVRTDIGIMHRS
jgi:hypothetical protein